MADGVEAAVRSMPEKTPESISMMVDKLVDIALTDGQLDECRLTLLDIQHIKRAFVERLCAVYHQRPSYPTENRSRDDQSDNATEDDEQPPTPASA
jgi:membrane-associated HD superfamily phosphohydrolase